jgi:tRNA-Thr(GGU) m(6)t(6)A37 methyltransferase TsaA
MELTPIGWVRSPYQDVSATPVQTALNPDEEASVELVPELVDGLWELGGFDYVWVLTWLGADQATTSSVDLRQVPMLLSGSPHDLGVFAMRGPRRPNPIGLHLVRLVEVTAIGFTFRGLDMVDGTPVLDIKPWAAAFDVPQTDLATVRGGWIDGVDLTGPNTPASLRRAPFTES